MFKTTQKLLSEIIPESQQNLVYCQVI